MTQPPGHPGRSGYGDDPYRPPGHQAPYQDPGGPGPGARPAGGYRPRHGRHDDDSAGYPDETGTPPAADPDQGRIPRPPPGRPPHDEGPPYREPHHPDDEPAAPRRGNAGMVTGIIGVVSVLLLVAVVGFFLVGRDWRDGAGDAGPSPTVNAELAVPTRVVDRWLRAMFILKDPDEMLRFTCRRGADRAELKDAVDTVKQAEQDAKDADLTMTVSWSEPTEESRDEARAKVRSTIKWIVGEKTRESPASFDLVFEEGWKVCASEMT